MQEGKYFFQQLSIRGRENCFNYLQTAEIGLEIFFILLLSLSFNEEKPSNESMIMVISCDPL